MCFWFIKFFKNGVRQCLGLEAEPSPAGTSDGSKSSAHIEGEEEEALDVSFSAGTDYTMPVDTDQETPATVSSLPLPL
ncbi:hypothetical protein DCAR_0100941 [Daucus carota subsp. sativus]|uniref:Uncharacterized protein n=1 Tax=Daucus carota subsp. sativus TaxID=79200 RepID=A0A162A3S2_DAUCS|nr:hypothetical protein DCAR_0100941 [Daucus carota subsp. sativus]